MDDRMQGGVGLPSCFALWTRRTSVTSTTRTVLLNGVGPVEVSLEEFGAGRPFLLLHGGGGPDTVTRFGAAFAETHGVRTLVPVHPGFALTPRPTALDSIPKLAALYVALMEDLNLSNVTAIGNSIGGWIVAEMALLGSPRISGMVLIDAVGMDVPEYPVADFFTLSYDDFLQRAFHQPERFRVNPASLSPGAQQAMAANRSALAAYTGHRMNDPTLRDRLDRLRLPTLVLWGASDRVAVPEYGRALAAAIPTARFLVLPAAGHLPQVEAASETDRGIWDYLETVVNRRAAS
jgi:pimeloyl-ACP methyl ester carboxylesterase